jgi:hypothetical protein
VGGNRVGCEDAEGFREVNFVLKELLREELLDDVIVGVDVVGIGNGGNGDSACWGPVEDFAFIRLVEWDRCRRIGMVGVTKNHTNKYPPLNAIPFGYYFNFGYETYGVLNAIASVLLFS